MSHFRATLSAVSLLAAIGCSERTDLITESAPNSLASAAVSPNGVIPDRYFVVFKNRPADLRRSANDLVTPHGGEILFTYEHVFYGFSARLPSAAVEALRNNPNVDRITPEHYVDALTEWGLDRIDQRDLPLNNSFQRSLHGTGVTIYMVDSGIRANHNQFLTSTGTSRIVQNGTNFVADGRTYCGGTTAGDTAVSGHGTHLTGIAGGKTYGVADSVTIVDVRVLNCFLNPGSTSNGENSLLAGLDWILANAVSGPRIVNLSIRVRDNLNETETAVQALLDAGMTVVVAAGNDKGDVCQYSPARIPGVITVAASQSNDLVWDRSNQGSCLDIFAPGDSIVSAWDTGTSTSRSLSGTSQATAHVSGAAALYLQTNPSASPTVVRNALVLSASENRLSGFRTIYTSPNRLLYVGSFTAPPLVSTAISGVTSIMAKGTYTFTSNEAGFTAPTRVWEECFGSGLSSCGWTALAFGSQSISRTLDVNCSTPRYFLRVTVTDANGASATDNHSVNLCMN